MSKADAGKHLTVADDGQLPHHRRPFHLEAKGQPLLGRSAFARRFVRFALLSTAIILFSLALGVAGYHLTERLSWSDALLNASMILGGMGPVDRPVTLAGKLFSSFYALFSGIVFLISVGVLLAPILHRFMHRFHLELDLEDDDDDLE